MDRLGLFAVAMPLPEPEDAEMMQASGRVIAFMGWH
jgi:hypothetical protein